MVRVDAWYGFPSDYMHTPAAHAPSGTGTERCDLLYRHQCMREERPVAESGEAASYDAKGRYPPRHRDVQYRYQRLREERTVVRRGFTQEEVVGEWGGG